MKNEMYESDQVIKEVNLKLFSIINILKEASVPPEDYYFVLFLLSSYKDGLVWMPGNNDKTDIKQRFNAPFTFMSGNKPDLYRKVLKTLNDSIDKLDNSIFVEIISILNSIRIDSLTKKYSEIFDNLLYRIIYSQGKVGGEISQPYELTRFINSLISLPKKAKIFNPFAGLASFGTNLNIGQKYKAQDVNKKVWALGILRLMAYNKIENSEYTCDNSILNWPSESIKFDLIISFPPLGLKISQNYYNVFPNIQTVEQFVIEKGIRSLSSKGKLIVILSQGFLSGRGTAELKIKQQLIESDILESVISLPAGLLKNTGIPISILVINNFKEKPGIVSLVDANDYFYESSSKNKRFDDNALKSVLDKGEENKTLKFVTNEEIVKNKYNLFVTRYFISEIEAKDNFELISLSHLVSGLKKERITGKIPPSKYVRIKDLLNDPQNNETSFSNVQNAEIPTQGSLLKNNSLLISKKHSSIKPTFFTSSRHEIFFNYSDIFACKIKTEIIDKDYLINELHSDYVKNQIEAYRRGGAIKYLSTNDLLSVKIKIPKPDNNLDYINSLKEQRAKVKGIKEAVLIAKAKELGLENQIKTIKQKQNEDLRIKKHNISQHLNNVKSSVDSLFKFMENNDGILKSTEIINPKQGITVQKRFEKLKDSLDETIDLVDNITNEITFGEREVLDAKKMISECIQKGISNKNFEIDFQIDELSYQMFDDSFISPQIEFSIQGFNEVYNNILENAINHGFVDKNKRYTFRIELRHEYTDGGREIVTFSNNGKPFPTGMKERFCIKGEKAGKFGNRGIGTWKICEIVKHFGGDVIPYDNIEDEFPVKIEIILPYKFNFTL